MARDSKLIWLAPNITARWNGPYYSLLADLDGLGFDTSVVGYYNECYIGRAINPALVDRVSNAFLSSFNPKAKLNRLARRSNLIEVSRFTKFLIKNRVDVILTTAYYTGLHQAARRAGARTVLWSVDDPATHCPVWFEYAREFDHVFTYSRGSVRIYRANGCSRVDWLPMAVDSRYYFPKDRPILYDFSFVGSNLADRTEGLQTILIPLMTEYPNFHVFGNGWDSSLQTNVHGPVDWRSISEIYGSSKIVVNIHRDAHKLVEGTIALRVFEALGCRSFLLTDNPLGLGDLFEDGKDLVVVTNKVEALELAGFYLEEPEARRKIATNGYEKVMSKHTIHERAKVIASVASKV